METSKLTRKIRHLAFAGLTRVFGNRHYDPDSILVRGSYNQLFYLMRRCPNANDVKDQVTAVRGPQQLDTNGPIRVVVTRIPGGGQVPRPYRGLSRGRLMRLDDRHTVD